MTNAWCCIPPAVPRKCLALATTQVSFSRSPVLTFTRSSTLWLRRPQELFSLSYWRSLTKRISVSTHICSQYTSYYVINCNEAKLSLCVSSAYVSANDENGERILHTAPSSPLPKAPALPPKQGLCQPHRLHADSPIQTWLMITSFILLQIGGPAAPCPGLPPLTDVSWPHQCQPLPPTQWGDSSSPLRLSHRVSRQCWSHLLHSNRINDQFCFNLMGLSPTV